ncbi:MAG: D-alanyl-D-alanine carboxypeptidase [Rubrobacteridae bacterium]|nr:D-alanyl-D-alanine carboxypeptidase [Rubrobacteridae bacterium]
MKKILCVCLVALFVITGIKPQITAYDQAYSPLFPSVNSVAEAAIITKSAVAESKAASISIAAAKSLSTAKSATPSKAPAVTAASVLIKDAKTGVVVWRKNANQQQHMASTTKIITAVLALENCNLDETVTVRSDAVAAGKEGGVKLALNEQIKLRDLMYALLLPSANDAAVAIADHVAGSQKTFVAMMNKKASKLGAKRTHFTNPHGLDDRLHYSTVGDLALFAEYAMKNPEFEKIVATKKWTLCRTNPKLPCVIENTNMLLGTYYGVFGVKTGYTKKAQNCLVVGANRGDKSLICVVLGVKHRKVLFRESAALLDFGFNVLE